MKRLHLVWELLIYIFSFLLWWQFHIFIWRDINERKELHALKACLHIPSPSHLHCVYGDGQNGFCTHSIHQTVRFHWHNDKLDVDGDGHGDGTCKQVLSLYNDYSSSVCNYQINWGWVEGGGNGLCSMLFFHDTPGVGPVKNHWK